MKLTLSEKDCADQRKKKRLSDTDIGLTSEYYRNINLDSVIPALSPILELFKKKQQI